MLGTIILALYDHARGNMGHSHRGIGFVDMLSSGSAGPVSVYAQVGSIDIHLNIVINLRYNEYRSERRVAPIAGIKRGFPYQPVYPCFRA